MPVREAPMCTLAAAHHAGGEKEDGSGVKVGSDLDQPQGAAATAVLA